MIGNTSDGERGHSVFARDAAEIGVKTFAHCVADQWPPPGGAEYNVDQTADVAVGHKTYDGEIKSVVPNGTFRVLTKPSQHCVRRKQPRRTVLGYFHPSLRASASIPARAIAMSILHSA